MSIPVASTTITVYKYTPGSTDGFDLGGDTLATVATGVRAHFSTPGYLDAATASPSLSMRLTCDPVDLNVGYVVEDEKTGDKFNVQWAKAMYAVLPHVNAQVWFQGVN